MTLEAATVVLGPEAVEQGAVGEGGELAGENGNLAVGEVSLELVTEIEPLDELEAESGVPRLAAVEKVLHVGVQPLVVVLATPLLDRLLEVLLLPLVVGHSRPVLLGVPGEGRRRGRVV